MPVNFSHEYMEAKKKYEGAKDLNEKIKYTEEMMGLRKYLKILRKEGKN